MKKTGGMLVVMGLAILLNGCTAGQLQNQQPGWQTIDTSKFSISLPQGWKYNELQGIDSFVGEFEGDGMRLGFDYGWYSDPLEYENHAAAYETIGGRRAKLVTPKGGNVNVTGVHFPEVKRDAYDQVTKLTMEGMNLTEKQQDLALAIFRTIKFKE